MPDSSSDWTIFWSVQKHALVQKIAFHGIYTIPVDEQVHIANGLPNIAIVGLADRAVAGSREHVRAAFSSIGLALLTKRIAVNLAPADAVKEGAPRLLRRWPTRRCH